LVNIAHIEEQDSVEHIKGARTTFVRFIPGTKYSSDIHIAVANEKVENNHIIIPEISESTLLHNLLGMSRVFITFFFITNCQYSKNPQS
jgi:hypothetical protein